MTFSFSGPEAESVLVAGDFTGWTQAPLPLKKGRTGIWKTTVALEPGRYEYRLLVNGEWRDDPACPNRHPNPFGGENCVRIVE